MNLFKMCANLITNSFEHTDVYENSQTDSVPNEGINHFTRCNIPTEVLNIIFRQMDTKSQIDLRLVCAQWGSPLPTVKDCQHHFHSIIDIRNVLEFQPYIEIYQENQLFERARSDYQNMKVVVDLIGGWDQYSNLPSIKLDDFDDIKPSILPAPICRLNDQFGIVFRHHYSGLNDHGLFKSGVGYITLENNFESCSWSFSFGKNLPTFLKNNWDKHFDMEAPSTYACSTTMIPKPIQIVRELLNKPHDRLNSTSFEVEKNYAHSGYKNSENFSIYLSDNK